jgi:immune inhibitor A
VLVWYRDTTYGNNNHVTASLDSLPSHGAKGGLLLVDSHFDPFRRQGVAADKDPSTLNNLPSRPQSSNAAFGLQPTYPFRECYEFLGTATAPPEPFSEYCTDFGSQPPVQKFVDTQGWYPGLELRGSSLFYRDVDASTVIPSADNEFYSIRIVDANGNLIPALFGTDLGGTLVLGTGNPADDGVAIGVSIEVKNTKADRATVYVVPAP